MSDPPKDRRHVSLAISLFAGKQASTNEINFNTGLRIGHAIIYGPKRSHPLLRQFRIFDNTQRDPLLRLQQFWEFIHGRLVHQFHYIHQCSIHPADCIICKALAVAAFAAYLVAESRLLGKPVKKAIQLAVVNFSPDI